MVEDRVGHPGDRWHALQERVQTAVVRSFADVEAEWLELIWCLDQYRIAQVPPRGMGNLKKPPDKRLPGIYRGKGNWFAALMALLLENRTDQRIGPRQKVQGFSQMHQIDLAWPAREEDPRICCETKVTGAPGFEGTPARGAMADYTNRRKELKFAATDLKLYRRQQETVIDHWGVWREGSPPKTYSLWAARLTPKDTVAKMIREAKALVDTYLDGAGIFAWREATGGGYEAVPVEAQDRVSTLDDVLHRIAAIIRTEVGPTGEPPPPVVPERRALAPEELPEDQSSSTSSD